MGPPIYIGGNVYTLSYTPKLIFASMGPPIYIGGNSCIPPGTLSRLRRLQWGHRFTSVETGPIRTRGLFLPGLQWGHRFTSVETQTKRPRKGTAECASMGPPIYIGGNTGGRTQHNRQGGLQWGHRFTSVETYKPMSYKCAGEMLQWGHRFTSVETQNYNIVFTIGE